MTINKNDFLKKLQNMQKKGCGKCTYCNPNCEKRKNK